jgi:DNA (cytosine-5)-methyltransferase 1
MKVADRRSKPKVIDLFCGVGGLSLGAARAGFEVVAAVDCDPRALDAYRKNFPASTAIAADISSLDGDGVVDKLNVKDGQIFGIVGGPPCQGFSTIGHRQLLDKRNSLFEDFFRLVRDLQPSFFVAENVLGILESKYDSIRRKALDLVSQYHILEPIVLNSADFGAPTSRERIFFIGYIAKQFKEISPTDFDRFRGRRHVHVREALFGLPRKIDPDWRTHRDGKRTLTARSHRGMYWTKTYRDVPSKVGDPAALSDLTKKGIVSGCLGTVHTAEVVQRFSKLGQGEVDSPSRAIRLQARGFCPTLRAGTGPERGSFQALRPIHPSENRVITPREAARLQGFPDWFVFDNTKWHSFRQIGNSVSPIVAEAVLSVIARKRIGEKYGR